MDEWRVELFERECGRGSFPTYRGLMEDEAAGVRVRVREALGVEGLPTDVELWRAVEQESEVVEGVNAEDDGFDLRKVLENLGLETRGEVLVNWGGWSEFDVMRMEEVVKYFSDLWFPSSDDLSVFDVDLSWVLSVSHHGVVSFLTLR